MVRLTDKKKREILKVYRRNEENNSHSDNAVMLINIFGTKAEQKKAKKLKKDIEKRGYVNEKEGDWFYKHGQVYFKKLIR